MININESITIAFKELLQCIISINEIESCAQSVDSKWIPFYSTHDLALVISRNFFEKKQYAPLLKNAQMTARLLAIIWNEQKLVSQTQSESFEKAIYLFYKHVGSPIIIQKEYYSDNLESKIDVANFQFLQGKKYNFGYGGVIPDYAEAALWYAKAANQGHAQAQWNLGNLYANGMGVEPDLREAVEWYTKAALQGHAQAQNDLGEHYSYGQGINEDKYTAVEWYSKAAQQGNADAQNNLGCMYLYGEGVEQNKQKAFDWYERAAQQGHAEAEFNLGVMYQHGDGIDKNLHIAFKWYKSAAEHDLSEAQYNIALMYEHGYGVEQNTNKAMEWYKKTAKGYSDVATDARCKLGDMYYDGYFFESDKHKAFELYFEASFLGNSKAQYNLASMYDNDEVEEQDYRFVIEKYPNIGEQYHLNCFDGFSLTLDEHEKKIQNKKIAIAWYSLAAEEDYAPALNMLGCLYLNGESVDRDQQKAIEFFLKAAEFGEETAQYNLGVIYETGEGVDEDKEKAVEWYSQAAQQGNADAKKALGELSRSNYRTG